MLIYMSMIRVILILVLVIVVIVVIYIVLININMKVYVIIQHNLITEFQLGKCVSIAILSVSMESTIILDLFG